MSEQILGLKVGSARVKARIKNLESRRFTDTDRNDRVFIHAEAHDGSPFKVSEVWIKNHKNEVVSKNLWKVLDDSKTALRPSSLLAQLMSYLQARSTDEMIGKEITLEPKVNGFMAIVMYE